MPVRRDRPSTTSRKPGAPAAMVCRRECVLIYSGSDFVRWRQMLEANGELTDSARGLLRDMERYAAGTRCRHRALVEYFGERYDRDILRQLRLVPEGAVRGAGLRPRWRARFCRAWRACGRRGASATSPTCCSGKASEKVQAAGHDTLSTFGLLKEESGTAIRGYIEQLVADGLLLRDGAPVSGAATDRVRGARCSRARASACCIASSSRSKAREAPRRGRPCRSAAIRELFDVLREVRLRWRASAACRLTSSFTTRRCARWPIGGRRPSTICTTFTASARRRRPTSATPFSMRSELSAGRNNNRPTGRTRELG